MAERVDATRESASHPVEHRPRPRGLFARYSGVSLGAQVTAILAGSLAPILATQWLRDFGSWLPIALYIVAACIVTSIAVLSLKETRGISLRDIDAADAARTADRVGAKGSA